MNTVLGMEAPLLGLAKKKKLFSWHPYKKAGASYDDIIHYYTVKRLGANDSEADDIFSKLLVDNQGSALGLKLGEVLAECSLDQIANIGFQMCRKPCTTNLSSI